MSKIYCGINKIPKGHKRGNMKECAEKGQIRYYGIKKVDQKMVELAQSTKRLPNKFSVTKKLIGLRAKIMRDQKIYDKKPDKELKKIIDQNIEKYNELVQLSKAIDAREKSKKKPTLKRTTNKK